MWGKLSIIFFTCWMGFSQTVVDLGDGEITASLSGIGDSHADVSGDALGAVTFDLTITPINGGVFNGPEGIAVTGGSSNVFLDNGNDLDPSNDEGISFSLSNIQNLPPGAELKISGITTLFGSGKQCEIGDSGVVTISPSGVISVNNQDSATVYARGEETGSPTNTTFALDNLLLTLIDPNAGTVDNAPAENIIQSFIAGENGEISLHFTSEAGKKYIIQSTSNLAEGSWADLTEVTGTGGEMRFTENIGDYSILPKNFYRVCKSSGLLVNDQVLEINQTWAEEPTGYARTAVVKVPSTGVAPYPVVLMLHGSGGNSGGFIQSMGGRLDGVIRVAPQGYGNQWNVDAENNTDAPDVDFIKELIALLKTYENVDGSQVSIMGNSNGSGMTNRLIIDLPAGTFQKAAGSVSQMIVKMYDADTNQFKTNAESTSVSYDLPTTPAPGLKILNINGTDDGAVPYLGGNGVGTTFHDSQDSIYWLAQAMGETGPKLTDSEGVPGDGVTRPAEIVKYAYLGGDVVHYKVIGGAHNLAPFSSESSDLVADFLLNQ